MELYQHNKDAYEKVQAMFGHENRVAVVHATGTGKSFIALQWLYANRDKKCLFLAPTYEIIDQLELHMASQGLNIKDFPNLVCDIYSSLAHMSDEELKNIHFNNIVLEEFHRCGAKVWGECVNTILKNNSDAKVLGLSATPIRYLDHQKNMADELFYGNVASEISLSDAIADGILPMPTYISAAYSFNEDIERIQNKIDKMQNSDDKAICQQQLEEAKRNLEAASGLPEIFEKHILNRTGKYIVFCRDYEHMFKMMQEAKDWLKNVNANVDQYVVYSGQGRDVNQRNLANFEAANNNHLKLLFSIEMLNEGVHVKDIDGVVMLRPTCSPIIYLQQLGRALSVGHNQHPVIFDIVNNINDHKIIYDVYDTVQKKITESGNQCTNHRVDLSEFRIIDELKSSSEFIKALDDMLDKDTLLASKYEKIVQDVIKFKQQYGRMPSHHKNDFEKKLYWSFYDNKEFFTMGQIELLKSHGINAFREGKPERIEKYILKLIKWVNAHNGVMPSRYSDDSSERKLYWKFKSYKKCFTEKQLKLMENHNIKIIPETRTEKMERLVSELITWADANNGVMPSRKSDAAGKKLYWCFKDNKEYFSVEQAKLLESHGIKMVKESRVERIEKLVLELTAWMDSHDRKKPSKHSSDPDERKIAYRFQDNKEYFTLEQKQRLIAVGMPAKSFEKRSKVIINPQDANRTLKQKPKTDDKTDDKDSGVSQ